MVAAELKNTSRDLPRAIHTAEPTVIGCYVLINVAYYVLVPWDVLGKSNSIAVVRINLSSPHVLSLEESPDLETHPATAMTASDDAPRRQQGLGCWAHPADISSPCSCQPRVWAR